VKALRDNTMKWPGKRRRRQFHTQRRKKIINCCTKVKPAESLDELEQAAKCLSEEAAKDEKFWGAP
jgi:hypothetical protein